MDTSSQRMTNFCLELIGSLLLTRQAIMPAAEGSRMLIDCLEVVRYPSRFLGNVAYIYHRYAHRWHAIFHLARTDWHDIILHIKCSTSVSRLT